MKILTIIFGTLSVVCILLTIFIMADPSVFAYEDVHFLRAMFGCFFFFSLCALCDIQSWPVYSREYVRRRKVQSRSMVFLMGISISMLIFTLFL